MNRCVFKQAGRKMKLWSVALDTSVSRRWKIGKKKNIPVPHRITGFLEGSLPHHAIINQLKSKCGLLLAKAAALRVHLNLDGAPIASNSHTHPSHSKHLGY